MTDLPKMPEVLRDPVYVIGPDDFPACPVCDRRAKTTFTSHCGVMMPTVMEVDEQGPVFEATCPDHGAFRFQVQEDDDAVG